MQPLQAIYRPPSKSESLPSTVASSDHEHHNAHEIRVHHIKDWCEITIQYKGRIYAATLIAVLLVWTIVTWILYTPTCYYPWDYTALVNQSHRFYLLAASMSYLSTVLPIFAGVSCWVYYQFSRPSVSGGALATTLIIITVLWLVNMIVSMGVNIYQPADFALPYPFVHPSAGQINFANNELPLGIFSLKNETAVCDYLDKVSSPFKQIVYTIEEDALSFKIICPDESAACAHGTISYTDTQVDMDVYIESEMYHISSVSPKFRATPGPWKDHTSLYSSSKSKKLFLIYNGKDGTLVYGNSQFWRAFGSCWNAFVLTKWPKQ